MSNRGKLRQVPPGTAAKEHVKAALRCWSCAAEPRLSFTTRRGLSAAVEHLPGCPAVPAEERAAGRLVHTTAPVLWELAR